MKPKHLEARVKQCLAVAECSPCTRRKFGALLIDPVRNVILMDGYNGGPRGGHNICGGDRCIRDGLRPEDVEIQRHPDNVRFRVHGQNTSFFDRVFSGQKSIEDCLAYREQLLKDNPSIQSGTRMELGCHHAEANVITNAAARGVATAGSWIIVTGEPCLMCAKLIHHSGIDRVVCVRGGFAGGDAGPAYLREHNVTVAYVDGPTDPRSV